MRRLIHILAPLLLYVCLVDGAKANTQKKLHSVPLVNTWQPAISNDKADFSPYEHALQRMTENQVLTEIQRLQGILDNLTRTGRIESSTNIAAGAALATVAYGIAHAQLAWLFQPGFFAGHHTAALIPDSSWINAILCGIVSSVLPGTGVGALLGTASYLNDELPAVSPEELIIPGLTAIVSTLGMTILGATLMPVCHGCMKMATRMYRLTSLTVPISASAMFVYIATKRQELLEEKLDLTYRLKEAREALNRKSQSTNLAG